MPAAPDDLVGSSSVHFVHVCHMYIQYACTGAWKLVPQGPISFDMLYYFYLFIFLNKTPQTNYNIYINFENWKRKYGERDELKVLIKGRIGKF